eukprot:TRINITY_DN1597_c1_g1_i3.p1 TRINITY_DN1597_c1_g1~~TRINITY_DN1597_c1_g1_i3.p1  ORF type:complete len:147 (-),score=52.29 TRINITY_DN1597_c1_g1_i3:53-493(-)
MFNPEVNVIGEGKLSSWEGCLSVPGLRGKVERPDHVEISFENERGQKKRIEARGYIATVLQHEIDHLWGHLFVDRLIDPQMLMFADELTKHHPETVEEEGAALWGEWKELESKQQANKKKRQSILPNRGKRSGKKSKGLMDAVEED